MDKQEARNKIEWLSNCLTKRIKQIEKEHSNMSKSMLRCIIEQKAIWYLKRIDNLSRRFYI